MRYRHRLLVSLLFLGGLAAPGLASFSMPAAVYRTDRLAEAREEARDRGVPISFIYSDEGTTCGLATAASIDLVEHLKDVTVIIYVSSQESEDWARTPNLVKRALNSPQAGKFIPIAVVVDAEIKKVHGVVPYVRDAGQRRQFLQKVRSAVQN